MPQQKDIVKIAIQMPGAYPQLIQLDQVGDAHTLSLRLGAKLRGKFSSSFGILF